MSLLQAHELFNHQCARKLKQLTSDNLVLTDTGVDLTDCAACIHTKQVRNAAPPRRSNHSTTLGAVIHMDLKELPEASYEGFTWIAVYEDEALQTDIPVFSNF